MGIWSSGINLAQGARGRSSILMIPQKSQLQRILNRGVAILIPNLSFEKPQYFENYSSAQSIFRPITFICPKLPFEYT